MPAVPVNPRLLGKGGVQDVTSLEIFAGVEPHVVCVELTSLLGTCPHDIVVVEVDHPFSVHVTKVAYGQGPYFSALNISNF